MWTLFWPKLLTFSGLVDRKLRLNGECKKLRYQFVVTKSLFATRANHNRVTKNQGKISLNHYFFKDNKGILESQGLNPVSS